MEPKTLALQYEDTNGTTELKTDNTTAWKELIVSQSHGNPEDSSLRVLLNTERDMLSIGDVHLSGYAKQLFINFINQ